MHGLQWCLGLIQPLVCNLLYRPKYSEWALDGWLLCDRPAAPNGQNPSHRIDKRGVFASAWKGETPQRLYEKGGKPQGLDQVSQIQVASGAGEFIEAHDMEVKSPSFVALLIRISFARFLATKEPEAS